MCEVGMGLYTGSDDITYLHQRMEYAYGQLSSLIQIKCTPPLGITPIIPIEV